MLPIHSEQEEHVLGSKAKIEEVSFWLCCMAWGAHGCLNFCLLTACCVWMALF